MNRGANDDSTPSSIGDPTRGELATGVELLRSACLEFKESWEGVDFNADELDVSFLVCMFCKGV